jgi:hypothetical protein
MLESKDSFTFAFSCSALILISSLISLTSTENSTRIINGDKDGLGTIRFNTRGDSLDLHGGDIRRFGDLFYFYGETYDCGYELVHRTPSTPFCGFAVAQSTDLIYWQHVGYLFDPTSQHWQNICNSSGNGCYRPHVVHNQHTNK